MQDYTRPLSSSTMCKTQPAGHVRPATRFCPDREMFLNNLEEEGLPTSFDASKRNIVVLDDLMAETDERVTNLFTKKSHHCNRSVIYLVQNLFPKNKESRTISLNSQYIVVFKNPRDVSQMTTLAKQMYPGRVKFVQEAFADVTSTTYGYILVDLKQDTPEDLRLRNYYHGNRPAAFHRPTKHYTIEGLYQA